MAVDYIGTFFTNDGFDFSGLLNADFFEPVRILFQKQHYVSATKLLVVGIDSVGFIEYGEIKENTFVKWLNTYSEIRNLGITAEELWEHRNSLLHMSNLDSRMSAPVRKCHQMAGLKMFGKERADRAGLPADPLAFIP